MTQTKNNPVDLAHILWRHLNDYQKTYKLHPDHYKVVSDIMKCRTSYLGGFVIHAGNPYRFTTPAVTGIAPNARP